MAWGAKTIPSGGYWAMPKQLWAPGMVLAGDSASMVNIPKLKGVHLAMHAGMFAAETIYEKLSQGADCNDLSSYQEKVEGSVIEKDLHRSRNMRQVFGRGFLIGGALQRRLGFDLVSTEDPMLCGLAGALLRARFGNVRLNHSPISNCRSSANVNVSTVSLVRPGNTSSIFDVRVRVSS